MFFKKYRYWDIEHFEDDQWVLKRRYFWFWWWWVMIGTQSEIKEYLKIREQYG